MLNTNAPRVTGISAPPAASAAPMSWSWFVKRSALWMAIVIFGVLSACVLYGVASKDTHSGGNPVEQPQGPIRQAAQI